MQSDARRRVLEMQRRASSAVWQPPVTEKECTEDPARISPESEEECTEEQCIQYTDRSESRTQCSKLPDSQKYAAANGDPEQMLLLAILVLLLAEKADTVLILALIYLML